MGKDWQKDFVRFRKNVAIDYDVDKDEYNLRIMIDDVVKMAYLRDLKFPDIYKVVNFLEDKQKCLLERIKKNKMAASHKRIRTLTLERKQCMLYIIILNKYIDSNRKIKVKFDLMDI